VEIETSNLVVRFTAVRPSPRMANHPRKEHDRVMWPI